MPKSLKWTHQRIGRLTHQRLAELSRAWGVSIAVAVDWLIFIAEEWTMAPTTEDRSGWFVIYRDGKPVATGPGRSPEETLEEFRKETSIKLFGGVPAEWSIKRFEDVDSHVLLCEIGKSVLQTLKILTGIIAQATRGH